MSLLLPGATIGMVGGGQLGRMAALVARRMGYRVVVLDPVANGPAGQVADRQIVAPYDDPDALDALADAVDVVTLEFENVPLTALRTLANRVPARPGLQALAVCQDRFSERRFLAAQGIPAARYASVMDEETLASAAMAVPFPALLKTATLGYDSKGQQAVATGRDLPAAFASLGRVPCLLEQRIEFTREISVIVARDTTGVAVTYDPAENVHPHGILDVSLVPATLSPELSRQARELSLRIAHALDLEGVMAVELFVTHDQQLLVNELAPRPHNSGHWSIEASVTSQFEQQIRIAIGAPVGTTTLLRPAATANLLGDLWSAGEPRWDRLLALPNVSLHLYGKDHPRSGRKMGHLTVLADTPQAAAAQVRAARALL